jgi:outer membrane protein OmpA-like peptidoglycan-associated protein
VTKYRILCLALLIAAVGLGALQIGMKGERYALDGMDYYQRGEYRNAITQFLAADRAADGSVPEYHYWLGRLFIAVADTSNAMLWLDRYLQSEDQEFRRQVNDYIEIIKRQDKIFERFVPRPLPGYLNSRNSDYGAVVDPAGKYLYFTSLRPDRYDKENIWRAEIFKTGYGKPELVAELASDKNEAFGCFSSSGEEAWVFGNFESGKLDGDIYSMTLDKKWSTPVNAWQFNSSQVETHPMVYEDRLMFFASSREGGIGGTDLYVSEKIGETWSEPQNLGPVVNSPENEQTPFLDYDGRTLFFASNGHPGFGGYDLFKAYRKGDTWQDWSIPENLGLPANSIRNDRYFYHRPDSNEGFISSDRAAVGFEKILQTNFIFTIPPSYLIQDSTGTKISIEIREEIATRPELLDSNVPTLEEPDLTTDYGLQTEAVEVAVDVKKYVSVTGRVTDDKGNPIQTDIEFTGSVDDERYKDVASSNPSGYYKLELPLTDLYGVVVNQEGYMLLEREVPIPQDGSPVFLNLTLQPLVVKKVFVFDNILFDFDSSRIKPESLPILDNIVVTMLNNPELTVEISGHTCNIGTAVYNQGLSERRAKSVVDYLISKGIDKTRLTYKGYGLTKPLNGNANEAERKKNRRVEVKVLE